MNENKYLITNYKLFETVSIKFTYYHGCSVTTLGEKIMKDGYLKPGNQNDKKGGKITPDVGRTYCTPNLKESIIYILGANMVGYSMDVEPLLEAGEFGYLFIIDENRFTDVMPDEDYVGQFINYGTKIVKDKMNFILDNYLSNEPISYLYNNWNENKIKRFLDECKNILTPLQYKKCSDSDNYSDFADIGKKLNKYLSDYWKIEIMKCGTSISNYGKLYFKEAYKFDKRNNPKLNPDGSNFFDYAEKIL